MIVQLFNLHHTTTEINFSYSYKSLFRSISLIVFDPSGIIQSPCRSFKIKVCSKILPDVSSVSPNNLGNQ